jgi:hypothetical protein
MQIDCKATNSQIIKSTNQRINKKMRIDQIKKEITDRFIAQPVVQEAYGLQSGRTFNEQFSQVSVENTLFYADAYRHLLLEQLFEYNTRLIDEKIRNQRAHTVGWYRQTALNYQHGREFRPDVTEYDNTGLTDEQISQERIIRKCSVTTADTNKPTLIIKVHKADGRLNAQELSAFTAYMSDKADAGVNVSIISANADRLTLNIRVRYDAMVIGESGRRFIDGRFPVRDAIEAHLNSLEFNGAFFTSLLEQELMKQTGIRVATVLSAHAGTSGALLGEVVDMYQPYSGALAVNFNNDLTVSYERF